MNDKTLTENNKVERVYNNYSGGTPSNTGQIQCIYNNCVNLKDP
jgi:hypothetical protein